MIYLMVGNENRLRVQKEKIGYDYYMLRSGAIHVIYTKYSERQKKLFIKKKYTFINYRNFYLKIASLPVFKIETKKKIAKYFEILTKLFRISSL